MITNSNEKKYSSISVCLPVFNRGPTLKRALDSIHNQTTPPYEVIICDFSSDDDSVEVIEKWILDNSLARFSVFFKKNCKKPSFSNDWNRTISKASGEYIAILEGDGSFQLNIQELQTVKHHNLPIKLIVWNNEGYLSIRATQDRFFDGRKIGTDPESGVSFPEVEKIAAAYGLPYVRINNTHELRRKMLRVLNSNGPVVCEVMCPENQEVIPAVSSIKNKDGSMTSKPIEDMYPFLDRDEFLREMIIFPLE